METDVIDYKALLKKYMQFMLLQGHGETLVEHAREGDQGLTALEIAALQNMDDEVRE